MRFALAMLAACFAAAPAAAQSPADFYAGKTITIVVGSETGGGYDAVARLMSRHISKHVPGNPKTIVQNMPGASSLVATNHIVINAPQDGTVIGVVQRGILTAQLLNLPNVRFEVDKINWIGNLSAEPSVVIAWNTVPHTTAEDLFKTELIVGGAGPTADSETTPRLLNAVLGTRFKIITGYRSNTDATLAMERGETQGIGDLAYVNVKRKPDLINDRKIKILMQHGLEPVGELKGVASTLSFAKTPLQKAVLELYFAQKDVGRPVMTGPGVPADRVAALRTAFEAMIKDPDFIADSQKTKLDVEPTTVEAVNRVVKLVKAATPEVAKVLNDAIGGAAK